MKPICRARMPVAVVRGIRRVLPVLLALGVMPEGAISANHGAGIFKVVAGPDATQNARVGDLVTARILVKNLDTFGDSLTITSIVDVVHHAIGDAASANLLTGPVTLSAYGDAITVTNTYIVQPADAGLASHQLLDDAVARGIDNHDGPGSTHVPQVFQISFPGLIFISTPLNHGAAITKTVAAPDGSQNARVGDIITAKIIVKNLDDFGDSITLTGLYDTNHHFAGDTVSPNLLSSPVILFPPGAGSSSVEMTYSYPVFPTDTNLPGRSLIDNAVAIGFDNHDGPGGSAISQAFQISFPGQILVSRPSLSMAQSFPEGLAAGLYNGIVSNSGNVRLSGIVVSNSVSNTFAFVLGPISLDPNQAIAFTNTFLPLPPAVSVPNTLLASGTDPYGLAVLSALSLQVRAPAPPPAAAYTFSTLAGSPRFGSADGVGTAAQFDSPGGLAVDDRGNLFVADANNTIRQIAPDGQVSTIAGAAGVAGSADGANGTARFSGPKSVAVGQAGTLYVADSANATIRKLTPDGTNWIVTTIAGSPGSAGLSDGLGGTARFQMPLSIAVESAGDVDNLYVADGVNTRVRKLTPAGGSWMVATVPGFTGVLSGVALNGTGTLYLADADLNTIRKITPVGPNWVLSAIAGNITNAGAADGTNSDARFMHPTSVAVDTATNLYVADTLNNTIRKIAPVGSNWIVSTLAGSTNGIGSDDGTGSEARFSAPEGIAVDPAGYVYVADTANGIVRQVTSAGVVSTIAGSISTGSANGNGNIARFNNPLGVAVDAAGNLYLADGTNAIIRKITPAGLVTTLAGLAGSKGNVDAAGSNARFVAPFGVAVDKAKNIYVTDNNTIRKITPAGLVGTLAGSATNAPDFQNGANSAARFNSPRGIAVGANSNLFVADTLNHAIRLIDSTGLVTTIAGAPGPPGSADGTGSAARFNLPTAIVLDSAGNLLVADSANSAIRKISLLGGNWIVTTVAGQAGMRSAVDGNGPGARFELPQGVAVDASDNLYIADSAASTIRVMSPAGQVATIAGVAEHSGSADGAGIAARFSNPVGIAVDMRGTIYVADTANNTIRKGVFTAYTPANAVSSGRPQPDGQLVVVAEPPGVKGQWRLSWELGWRDSGTVATNLTPGAYTIEFAPVAGYLPVPSKFTNVTVASVETTFVTNYYYPTFGAGGTADSFGSLLVDLGPNPPDGAGWRFVGENNPFFQGGFATNLLAGTYLIEFAAVSGRTTPPRTSVEIFPGRSLVVSESYLIAQTPPAGVVLPSLINSTLINDVVRYPPYGFNGQLQSDAGFGSGVAVQEHVVLTAAHLVFDDNTLSYASAVYWFLQKEKGSFDSPPLQARAIYALRGYAAQRTNDILSGLYGPGQSTPQSRNLDVAALYFSEFAAGGGHGGYLPSDQAPNPWLTSASQKMLVGYPVDGSVFGDTNIVSGLMYQAGPQPFPLFAAGDQVYLATWLFSYPGNSGGPLYVQYNGYYYPAGVYLGTLYSGAQPYASVIRGIDTAVTNLITQAALLADSGTNNTGGGVVRFIPDLNITPGNPGLLFWDVQPPAAVRAGGAWRVDTNGAYSPKTNAVWQVGTTNPVVVQFKPIEGWNTPGNKSVTVSPGPNTFTAYYTVTNPALATRRVGPGSIAIGMTGTTGTVYSLQRSASWSAGNWQDVKTITLGPGLNLIQTNGAPGFYRALWLTN